MEKYLKTSNYKILNSTGWKSFSGIRKLLKNEHISIDGIDGYNLKCSLDHKILTDRGWIFARDIDLSDSIQTIDGLKRIISKNISQEDIEVYDLIDVENHSYLTNNIVSHNCSFIGSANTLIDANKLNQLSYGKPRHRNGEGLLVYEDPIKGTDEKENPDHQYFITVDVARGQGKDNSAFVVVDITTMPYRVVARFKSNVVSPLLLPSYIRAVGKKYNNAYVLVEVNDIGSQVADILHNDLEYENLIKSNFKGTKGQTITEMGGGNRLLLGVRTTNPVKKLGCAILKNLIEQDKIVVEDSDTIDELTTFIADGVSFRADDGHTDDLVMCLVLFSWATRQDFFETLTNKDIRVEMFNEEIEKIEAEIVPFGFIEDGRGDIGEVMNNDVWFDRNDRKNNISTQFWVF